MSSCKFRRLLFLLLVGWTMLATSGCGRAERRIVVYCALDREFAQPILDTFTKETGLEVVMRFDTEANKSIGLYEDILREEGRPRCDVHWNNEVLATIRLRKRGLLEPYHSPAAASFPSAYRAEDGSWTAFAARARVILVNTEKVKESERPRGLKDLIERRWRGRVAMARPIFGTTATHAACLFAAWGPEKAKAFYEELKANDVKLLPGNKQVAVEVGQGRIDAGMTDTDDALAEIDRGRPVAMIFPDAEDDGTLLIPNTLALIKKAPNPAGGKLLIDYLLRPEVEVMLAQGRGRQVPLNPNVKVELPAPMRPVRQARSFAVDFNKAAEAWEDSQSFLLDTFALR